MRIQAQELLSERLSREWLRGTIALPGCVVILAVHVIWADAAFDFEGRVYAGLLGCLAFLTVLFVRRRTVPLLALAQVQLYIAMARPVFDEPRLLALGGPVRFSSAVLNEALLGALVFASMVALVSLSSEGPGRKASRVFASADSPAQDYTINHSLVARAVAGASAFLFCFFAVRGTDGLDSLAQPIMLFTSPAVSLGLLFWDFRQTQSLTSRWLFYVTFATLSALGLTTGMLSTALLPGVVAAILMWSVWGRIPLLAMTLGLLFLLVFNAAKHDYRALSWYNADAPTLAERVQNWGIALEKTYGGSSSDAADTGLDSASSRTAVLPYVAQIFAWVPSRMPHAGPERWLQVPLLFIPRILWADKPDKTELFNDDYSLSFSLQTRRGVRGTTKNLPAVGDGYWRLGWLGVILEGGLLGLVLGFFSGLARNASRETLLLAAAFAASLHADAHVIGMIAGIPQLLIAMGGVLWFTRALPESIPMDPKDLRADQGRSNI